MQKLLAIIFFQIKDNYQYIKLSQMAPQEKLDKSSKAKELWMGCQNKFKKSIRSHL